MKFLLLGLSLQTITAPDRWFTADKVQHFFIGTFVQSASFGVLRAAKVDRMPALGVGILVFGIKRWRDGALSWHREST